MNEDVFPIEKGDFPASHVSFQAGVYLHFTIKKSTLHVGKYPKNPGMC